MATLFLLFSLAVTGICSFCKFLGKSLARAIRFMAEREHSQARPITKPVELTSAPAPVAQTGQSQHDLLDFDEFCDIMDEGE